MMASTQHPLSQQVLRTHAIKAAIRDIAPPSDRIPRVAFFTDSYHEANGVALTSRQFAAYARASFAPFFSVHAGPETAHWRRGAFETYELKTSRAALHLEHDLTFDLGVLRHRRQVRRALTAFRPDLIHVTGPGHMGLLGALLAYDLKVPLVASWHTNVHEFGAHRLAKLLGRGPQFLTNRLSPKWTQPAVDWFERRSLDLILLFYRQAKLLFAPNPELVRMLEKTTGRPVHLMERGIDTELYRPGRRPEGLKQPFTIGYVGRLSAEKNIRKLVEIDRELRSRGIKNHRYLIVGDGSERAWLARHLEGDVELTGLLRGEPLADAYARMDIFLFPSETDTFGNVILEALASGLPAVVSNHGGPKFLVNEHTGFVATDVQSYAEPIAQLYGDRKLLSQMHHQAREASLKRSWSSVFQGVYSQYREAFAKGHLGSASTGSHAAMRSGAVGTT